MQNLTLNGQNLVNRICSKYGLSYNAVLHMLIAVNNGNGTMAQFNCPELGGGGQWMRGGMIMVGDMFNNGLKMTVDNLCNELSNALANMQIFEVVVSGPNATNWYPYELGTPSSSGSQNNIRYAVFPQTRRLAIDYNGSVTIYDTLDHNIGGVSQQQGGDTSLTFSSQYGTILVNTLPRISGNPPYQAPVVNFVSPQVTNQFVEQPQNQPNFSTQSNSNPNSAGVLELLEKLGKLHEAGVLTEAEFNSKKTELLNRL
ncbi:MAG: SHOCT domain-containing protein [Leptospiraceae bacterium]|nr:SHOCT domain-containing protein [Leptospiraceae bacterium]